MALQKKPRCKHVHNDKQCPKRATKKLFYMNCIQYLCEDHFYKMRDRMKNSLAICPACDCYHAIKIFVIAVEENK